jgi:hypothetical protein
MGTVNWSHGKILSPLEGCICERNDIKNGQEHPFHRYDNLRLADLLAVHVRGLY